MKAASALLIDLPSTTCGAWQQYCCCIVLGCVLSIIMQLTCTTQLRRLAYSKSEDIRLTLSAALQWQPSTACFGGSETGDN
jgi:hypothetical protein